MAAHVNPESLLMGDFNCVEDVALDTHRSANTPYANAGADVLAFIKNPTIQDVTVAPDLTVTICHN
eukprot:6180338-Pleurochrysis_carterae.AAC.2